MESAWPPRARPAAVVGGHRRANAQWPHVGHVTRQQLDHLPPAGAGQERTGSPRCEDRDGRIDAAQGCDVQMVAVQV